MSTETKEAKLLQVGDVIYLRYYNSLSRDSIDRVTPKRAFAGSTQFYRETSGDGSLNKIGHTSGWVRESYYLSTPELEASYNLQYSKSKMRDRLSDILKRIDSMTQEQLDTLLDKLKP